MTGGIYIHVPFCRRKCDYCAFYSVPARCEAPSPPVPDRYIRTLIDEIRERLPAAGFTSADTVYFGGGTPSLLAADQLSDVLGVVRQCAELEAGAEITLEMNPGDVSVGALEGFRDAGVNRVVLGVQTLNARLHGVIGRSAALCTAGDLDLFFCMPGIVHCADIITGIPTQGVDELARDIDLVVRYRPSHISAYVLSVEKNTPLAGRISLDAAAESEQAALFEAAMARLKGHGYEHYEISNYALPGFRSRHNMKYWRFDPYIGCGPGAHSFVRGERYINAMTVEEYMAAGRALLDHDERRPGAVAAEYIMTGLRLLQGMSLDEMEERIGLRLPGAVMDRIRKAEDDGMVALSGAGEGRLIRLTTRGIMVADRVIYGIVEPLL